MPSYARKEIVCESEVQVFHAYTRCVRRAFLCGDDLLTGKNFDHRKEWVEERLQDLSSIMALDICGFAVMGNHLHVVVRTRPDLVAGWSDEEVARRWWRLFPKRRDEQGQAAEPKEQELGMLLADAEALAERRRRLSSLSWFMRCLSEPIARRSNKEDGVSGRFFEGRFKCQKLLDEAAILACSVYVDLNPVRAGIADTPDVSAHTSAYERIQGRQQRQAQEEAGRSRDKLRGRRARADTCPDRDAWLCPVSVDGDPPEVARAAASRRASNKGFLSMESDDYLRILDWTGRQVRRGKRGAIPKELAPLLERLGMSAEFWVETATNFDRWFHRAAGRVSLLAEEADRAGKRWFQGAGHCQQAFAQLVAGSPHQPKGTRSALAACPTLTPSPDAVRPSP